MSLSMFEEIKTRTLQEQILEKLKDLIKDGSLKAGQFLPSERDLAKTLGVSRIPLREALNELQVLGVVERQHGRRTLIKGLGGIPITEIIEIISDSGDEIETVNQLKEIRLILEVEAAGLASQRRDKDDLKRLEELVEMMDKEYKEVEKLQVLSLRFHLAIVEAAKNRILSLVYLFFHDLQQRSRKYSKRIHRDPIGIVKDHKEIFKVIQEKDRKLAEELMRSHLDQVTFILPQQEE